MHISLSPFPPMAPHHPETQWPTGGDPEEQQTPQPTSAERANGPDAEERESRHGTRAHRSSEAALQDPSSPEYHELQGLKTRDREVRAHEMGHLAAAGPHARGGPSYDYERGADGRQYAVGGHVNIDTTPVPGNSEATLRKAETVRRAALAPAEPSPQDRRVAVDAVSMATEARMEIAAEQREVLTARIESGDRTGGNEGSGNDKESPVTAEPPATASGSLTARLTASGAIPDGVSAGSMIDLHI